MLSLVCPAGGMTMPVCGSEPNLTFEHLRSLSLLLLSKYLSTFVQILFYFLVIQMSVAMQPAG
jgi:hypothetical protein